MNRINKILIIINLIMIILVAVKCSRIEHLTEYELPSGYTKEQASYEIEREILFSDKGEFSEFKADGTRVNTSDEMKKEVTLEDGLLITGVNMVYNGNGSTATLNCFNPTSEEKGNYLVDVTFYNENGEELITVKSFIDGVGPNQTSKSVSSIPIDLANAYKYEVRRFQDEQ